MPVPEAWVQAHYALLHGEDSEGRRAALEAWKVRHVDPEWAASTAIRALMDQCPHCKSQRVASGKFTADRGTVVFRPKLRSFTFTLFGGVEPRDRQAHACLDCGFLWGQIDQAKLQAFMRRHCDEETLRECGILG